MSDEPNNLHRLALIGCGKQMNKNILPFLQRIQGHEIVACVDPQERAGRELQGIAGAGQWLPDVKDLKSGSVDAAILALLPEPSRDVTRHLVKDGVSCFVEKPAGPSTTALREMDQEARQLNAFVQVGFNFRFADAVSHLHQLTVDQRANPVNLTIDFYSKYPSGPQWGCGSAIEAWIRHNGVHAIDMARWFTGSPVTGVTAHVIPTGEHTFLGVLSLRHENSSLSILRVGNQTRKFIIGMGLHCLDGTRYSMPSLERVKLDLDCGAPSGATVFATRNLDHGWGRSGFGPELSSFMKRIGGGADVSADIPTLHDAAEASEICDRVLEKIASQFDFDGKASMSSVTGQGYAVKSAAGVQSP